MEDKKRQLKQQIHSIIPDIEQALRQEVDRIVDSGSISEEEYESYLNNGLSFILAKAIISQWFASEPYGPPKYSKSLKEFFNRIGRI